MDRHYYESHELTVAQHPSETDFRFMIRLIAFMTNAGESLRFTKGLSTDDEPELWQKTLTDEIELWIELGLPDIKRIKKAASISQQVKLYVYGGQGVDQWWKLVQNDCKKFKNVDVYRFDLAAVNQFASQIQRSMRISVMIQDGLISFSWDDQMLEFPMEIIHDQDQS